MPAGILPGDFNFRSAVGGVSATTDSASSIRPFQYHATTRGLTIHIVGESTASFDHGRNSDVDTSAEQITAVSTPASKGVLVKAANGNSGTIFVGNSDVTADATDATDGFELGAGESVVIKVSNANLVYVIASAVNQVVYWLTV